MAARFLVSYPCQDACGVIETGKFVQGAPEYACPGCDSRWIELNERKPRPAPLPPAQPASTDHPDQR